MIDKTINQVEIKKEQGSYLDPSTIIYGQGQLILKKGARIEEGCTLGLGINGTIIIGEHSRVTRSVLECNDYSIFHGEQSQQELYYGKIMDNAGGKIVLGSYNAVAPFSLLLASLGGSIITQDHVNIMSSSLEADGGTISIDSYSYTNRYAVLNGMGNITIGKHVLIAPHTTFYSGNHKTFKHASISTQGFKTVGIVIKEDVWVAANASIIDGVVLAKGCIIAANALVNKSTEPYGIYAGVPAVKVKEREC